MADPWKRIADLEQENASLKTENGSLKTENACFKSQKMTVQVQVYVGNKCDIFDIPFSNSRCPLETVKEEVRKSLIIKRGINLDSFILVNAKNSLVTNFDAIRGQSFLVFRIPEVIVPLSAHDWSDTQLDQLMIDFDDVNLEKIFENADLPQLQMSVRGNQLVTLLSGIDNSLFRKYVPEGEGEVLAASAKAIRENSMLQNPICKSLYLAKTLDKHESFVDDFVRHLLNELGFNNGSLYAAPQMRMGLCFGTTMKSATADFTIIDLLSNARVAVVEDKNWSESNELDNSTAQLVAEGIAMTQRNESIRGKKRDVFGNLKAETESRDSYDIVYGIRVSGSTFHFYALRIGSEIHTAMKTLKAAASNTTMYRYKSEVGLDFLVPSDREEIILMLSLLQEVANRKSQSFFGHESNL